MKRLLFIIMLMVSAWTVSHAQYYSVNYDKETVAAMATAFGAEAVAEGYYSEQVGAILEHYNAAEVAAAGIFASKFLERKALTDLGLWNSCTENYYYNSPLNFRREFKLPLKLIGKHNWFLKYNKLKMSKLNNKI